MEKVETVEVNGVLIDLNFEDAPAGFVNDVTARAGDLVKAAMAAVTAGGLRGRNTSTRRVPICLANA